MAHSVENRVPFLDHDLVELAWRLPARYLLRPGLGLEPRAARSTKRILKSLAAKRFGSAFAHRPKSGFALPLRNWLQRPAAAALLLDQALPALAAGGHVDAAAISRLFRQPGQWSSAHVEMFWAVLSLGVWMSTYARTGQAMARRAALQVPA